MSRDEMWKHHAKLTLDQIVLLNGFRFTQAGWILEGFVPESKAAIERCRAILATGLNAVLTGGTIAVEYPR